MKIAILSTRSAVENVAAFALSAQGAEVIKHRDVSAMITTLRRADCDAVLLEDCEKDLLNWLAMLQIYSVDQIPIVVVGDGGATAMARALVHGANDYAVMTESPRTLTERIEAQVMVRSHRKQAFSLQVGSYLLEADTQVLKNGSQEISLTGREFALAWALFENAGRVVTLNTLSMQVWGKSSDISKRTIEQHVYKLRRKLCADGEPGACGIRITTIYGVGYRLSERSADSSPPLMELDFCV